MEGTTPISRPEKTWHKTVRADMRLLGFDPQDSDGGHGSANPALSRTPP